MPSVCILGAGDLGGAIAAALADLEVASPIVLIDAVRGVAAGKALDLQQAGAITGTHGALIGTDDWSAITGSAVCIVADRHARPPWGESHEDASALVDRLHAFAGDAPIVFADAAGAPALIAAGGARGIARARLIGSAAHALRAAVTAIVSLEARCSPRDIALTVLGAPPAGFVVPWGEASLAGHALDRLLSAAQLARLEARAAQLWPPGTTALGRAAAAVTGALLRSSRRIWCVSTVLEGEFGVRGRVGIVPAQLDPHGIARVRVPPLDARERVRVEVALGA